MSIGLEEMDRMEILCFCQIYKRTCDLTVVTDEDVGRTSRERCVHEVFSVRREMNFHVQDR